MIKAFKSRDTRRLFEGERVPRFANIEKVAMRKLQMLHAAQRIDSLRIPPQNRLEALKAAVKVSGASELMTNGGFALCGRTALHGT